MKGWVHVESFTDPPESLLDYPVWNLRRADGQRTARKMVDGRPQGQKLVARLEGFEDRDAAARLNGSVVEVERRELPPTEEKQFYRTDLIGLRVRNLEGIEMGVVKHFVDAPAHPLMVVQGTSEHWVPAVPQHLRKVDLEDGSIVVDWPASWADEPSSDGTQRED